MSIKEIICKTALHYHDREFASNWDLNVYRGCGHRCIYCFAQYSHKYLDTEQFFDDIFIKTNVAEALNTDFSRRSWNGDPVNISGVTDGYQPLEKEYVLMPKIIETFIRHKNPMIITTKSTLLLRDIDLLKELNRVAGVSIQVSVSAIDEIIRKKIEPFASPSVERLEMISELNKWRIPCGVLMMPIIPHLTDNIENPEAIFKIARKNGAKTIIPQLLHLRGNTKNVFFNYVRSLFPGLESRIKPIYNGAYVNKNYLENFREKIRNLRKKHNFHNDHRESCRNKCEKGDTQLKLL
jgi:DNA repair photolyase